MGPSSRLRNSSHNSSHNEVIRIGTRGSLLATTQAGTIKAALEASGRAVELVVISTAGDRSSDPVAEIGVGVFTAALREAIAEGSVDMAVHSYKDLPTAPDDRFVIAAIPRREDARDALVARDGMVLGELPVGSVIGTSSPRRTAQLRALGLGLEIRPLRGNLDTRLNRVSNGDLDGVVVARAGLVRIGRQGDVTETLEPVQMLPAPAQGALAVECRAGDTELAALLSELDDADTRAAVTAERTLLAEWQLSQPALTAQSERSASAAASKGWRWIGEMEEIADFVGEDPQAKQMYLAFADFYRRMAADVEGKHQETDALRAFFKPKQ